MKTILASILAVAFLASTPALRGRQACRQRQGRRKGDKGAKKDDKKKDEKKDDKKAGGGW